MTFPRLPDWAIYATVVAALIMASLSRRETADAPEAPPPVAGEEGGVVGAASVFDPAIVIRTPPGAATAEGGTAFSVSKDGVWLTARHAVEGCRKVALMVNKGSGVVADVHTDGSGDVTGTRFVNAVRVNVDGTLGEVRLYEFDRSMRLVSIGRAESARFETGSGWRLDQVTETHFHVSRPRTGLFAGHDLTDRAEVVHEDSRVWNTRLDPRVFSSTGVDPSTMSVVALYTYVDHLKRTRQRSTRQEIALWKKFTTPGAVAIMMLLALPFAYLQTRSGAVGVKLFTGIMIGIVFWFANSLSTHVGMLNQWPPAAAATVPALVMLVVATAWLRWVNRH